MDGLQGFHGIAPGLGCGSDLAEYHIQASDIQMAVGISSSEPATQV